MVDDHQLIAAGGLEQAVGLIALGRIVQIDPVHLPAEPGLELSPQRGEAALVGPNHDDRRVVAEGLLDPSDDLSPAQHI
jgi:hypothetical protein